MYITVEGKKVGIPRYYRKKLDISKTELMKRSIKVSEKVVEYHKERDVHPFDGVKESRKQADKNLKARLSLRKKKL